MAGINFTDPTIDPDPRRPNYRITKCCGNCNYYFYSNNRQTMGNCGHPTVLPPGWPHPRFRKVNKTREAALKDREKLTTTHYTCVCDLHVFTGTIKSLNRVTRWCGARRKPEFENAF